MPKHAATMEAAPISPLLKVEEVARLLSCSRRELERMRAAGRFPAPDLTIGVRSPRWRASSVEAWIQSEAR